MKFRVTKLLEITQKITRICFKYNVFKDFCEYIRMENQVIKQKYLKKILKQSVKEPIFWKVKNSLLELEKDFIELKDRGFKRFKN